MSKSIVDNGAEVLQVEADAIMSIAKRIGDGAFETAVTMVHDTTGKVVVSGMGKSGLIGRKIAATLASTGTQSFFMHPAEAYHGDLGMVAPSDLVLAISYSGETEEIVRILPFLSDRKVPVLGITGNPESTLARYCSVHLDASIAREACPLRLAPTASTTAALALGDALAMAVMQQRGFKSEDFAEYHPGGSLGRRLISRVFDVMKQSELPTVQLKTDLVETLNVVSSGRLGACIVVGDDHKLQGIVTDGDLRRVLEREGKSSFDLCAGDIMSSNPITIDPNARLESAVQLMNDRNVTVLVVHDGNQTVGILHLFDCGL